MSDTPPTTFDELAKAELNELSGSLLYAERKLISEGDFLGAAGNVLRREGFLAWDVAAAMSLIFALDGFVLWVVLALVAHARKERARRLFRTLLRLRIAAQGRTPGPEDDLSLEALTTWHERGLSVREEEWLIKGEQRKVAESFADRREQYLKLSLVAVLVLISLGIYFGNWGLIVATLVVELTLSNGYWVAQRLRERFRALDPDEAGPLKPWFPPDSPWASRG